jgi:Ni2+-binding GTPase involved in maturation of urease and hydrogenase
MEKKMSKLSVEELEKLIFQIDLMLTEDVGELFTTVEEK